MPPILGESDQRCEKGAERHRIHARNTKVDTKDKTMTLTIELDADIEAALKARQNGRSREEMVIEAVRMAYVKPHSDSEQDDDPTLALFARWATEDATDDPEEIARREQGNEELLRSLEENPISFRCVDVGEDAVPPLP